VSNLPLPAPATPRGTRVSIADLIEAPGRFVRPPRLVIILRGLPGAGKTHVAKLIRSKEIDAGSEAPRMFSLDDYFECDGEV